jgi:hypothetical protein
MKKYVITLVEPDDFILSLEPKHLFSKINWKLFCNFSVKYTDEKINIEYERKEKEKNQSFFDYGGGTI